MRTVSNPSQPHSEWYEELCALAAIGELSSSEYEELRKHLFADDGRLRSFVNVYVNDEDIRYLQKESTPLKEGDTISIVPSIAGGSC